MRKYIVLILSIALMASLCSGISAAPKNTIKKLGALKIPDAVAATQPNAHTGPSANDSNTTSIDLSKFFPKPGYQGMINSCVGWATAYAMKSYAVQVSRDGTPFGAKSLTFSPSFVYNQINGGRDEGSSLSDAGALLTKVGAVPLTIMPYTEDFKVRPNNNQVVSAAPFKASGYELIKPDAIDVMKSFLRQGLPIVVGIQVFESFETYKGGVYKNPTGQPVGGHAMCIVGFDDSKNAFKLINSWSTDWGENGFAWIDYATFAKINLDAMVVRESVTTAPAAQLPKAPLEVHASKGGSIEHVEVNWKETTGAAGYIVARSEKPDAEFVEKATVRGTTWYDKDAKPKVMYYYAVRSLVGNTKSDWSEAAQGFVQVKKGVGIPQSLQAEFTGTVVKLWWNEVENAEAYHIYRYIADKDGFGLVGTSKDPGFSDPTLKDKPGTYYFLVTAFGSATESPNSSSVAVVIPAKATPVIPYPTGLVASRGAYPDKVVLNWDAVDGADSYTVQRYQDKDKTWVTLGTVKALGAIDTHPLVGKVAYYQVLSRAGNTSSAPSPYVPGHAGKIAGVRNDDEYDDASYHDQANSQETRKGKKDWFQNDTVFTNPKSFFTNFAPQDFFFIDEAKFFAVDPNFFKVPDNFFVTPDNFFN